MCPHSPPCPDASRPDREAARTIISHPEQGWSLLCNGIVVFEDTAADGEGPAPERAGRLHAVARGLASLFIRRAGSGNQGNQHLAQPGLHDRTDQFCPPGQGVRLAR